MVIVETPELAGDSYKVNQALKRGIPVVGLKYLDDCVSRSTCLDASGYLVVRPEKLGKDDDFTKGQIKGMAFILRVWHLF